MKKGLKQLNGTLTTCLSDGTNVSVAYLYIPPLRGGGADYCEVCHVVKTDDRTPVEPNSEDHREIELECRQEGRRQF